MWWQEQEIEIESLFSSLTRLSGQQLHVGNFKGDLRRLELLE
jgi:hypothetical protein